MLKVLELFGGIGACSNALKRLNIPFEVADYIEIDKYAVKSYNAIYGTNFEPQDITTWDKDIEVDLIMHGSPCQDFSLAGKQAGGDKDSGTRSSLMYETLRIVEKLKPKYVIWENVKNILSQKHRHNFDAYLEKMEELGYINYYQILNAKDYGIPQNRERVFTVSIRRNCVLKGTYWNAIDDNDYEPYFIFPLKQELKLKLKDFLEDEVDEKYYLTNNMIEYLENGKYNAAKVSTKLKQTDTGISPTLDTMQGGNRQPFIKVKNATKKGYLEAYSGDSVNLEQPNSRTRRGRVGYGVSQTLTTSCNQGVLMKVDIPQTVRIRKYPVNIQKLVDLLRKQKTTIGLTNKEISKKLHVPLTKVEHWFRKDNSFTIPDVKYWFKLKDILEIKTDEFDESIMVFEEREGVYEKSNRCYYENGISPALTSANADEKIISGLRIRKLTPKECWRLMGFNDEDFEKAEKVNSNTQLYKQAGNSIVVNVLVEIFKNLL